MASSKIKTQLYKPQSWELLGDTKHWTRLFEDMLSSEPFKALSPEAKILLFYLKREHKGAYNKIADTVVLPYSHIEKLIGIPRRKIKTRLEELQRLGFISVDKFGGLYRETNHYTFVSEWKKVTQENALAILKQLKAANKENRPKSSTPHGIYISSDTSDTT